MIFITNKRIITAKDGVLLDKWDLNKVEKAIVSKDSQSVHFFLFLFFKVSGEIRGFVFPVLTQQQYKAIKSILATHSHIASKIVNAEHAFSIKTGNEYGFTLLLLCGLACVVIALINLPQGLGVGILILFFGGIETIMVPTLIPLLAKRHFVDFPSTMYVIIIQTLIYITLLTIFAVIESLFPK